MNQIVLHLGSNIGKREENLSKAIEHIKNRIGRIVKLSNIYQTAAWGMEDQADFYNQAILVQSVHSPIHVLNCIGTIEEQMGRERIIKWGARLIDIDIIFFGERCIDIPRLVIPHPYMQSRRFVLIPLLEIIPDWVHPILEKDIRTLLSICEDQLEVKRI